jgi:hypothetical protein
MRGNLGFRSLFSGGSVLLLALSAAGCIAVSREITRQGVTSPAVAPVTDRGQWEVEQEWQCERPVAFDLERERATFNGLSAVWMEEGWEMADFDLVTVPDRDGQPDRICLVGTFRRWVVYDG